MVSYLPRERDPVPTMLLVKTTPPLVKGFYGADNCLCEGEKLKPNRIGNWVKIRSNGEAR